MPWHVQSHLLSSEEQQLELKASDSLYSPLFSLNARTERILLSADEMAFFFRSVCKSRCYDLGCCVP